MRMKSVLAPAWALCLLAAPVAAQFDTPAIVDTEFSIGSAYSPTLTGDGLTIFWTASRSGGVGGRDVWTMTRTAIDQPWTGPTNLAAVNTTASENYIDVRDDGKEMYLSVGAGTNNLYVSNNGVAGWGTPTIVTELNSTGTEDDPTLTRDALEIYFTSSRTGSNGGASIYRAFRPNTSSAWSTPAIVAEVDSASIDHSPAISGDGLTLIFASTRAGGGGGSSDHWIATRPDRGTPGAPTPFSAPVPLTNLNTSGWDHNGQQTADGFSFYYARPSTTVPEIYRADRTLPVVYGPSGPPKVGTPFSIYVRHGVGAGQVGVIAGSTSLLSTPVTFPGVQGQLELTFAPGLLFWLTTGGIASSDGKYTTVVPVPAIGGLAGQSVYFQGAVQKSITDLRIAPSKKFVIVP